MNGNLRTWSVASALTAIVIAAGGFMLGVQPALAAAASDAQTTMSTVAQQRVVQAKLSELAKVAAHQDELDAQRAVLSKAVPASLKANSFVHRMNDLAALDGVVISALTPGDGVAYAPAPPTSTATGSSGAASRVFGKTDPSITAKNFVVIPMVVSATGDRRALQQFTHDAQQDERLFLVSNYSLAPESDGAGTGWSATLTGSVYAVKR